MSRPSLAIIGYGDFTPLMIKHLGPHFTILVSSRKKLTIKSGLDFKQVDLKIALAQSIIVPSIPAQNLEEFFTANKKLVNPEALVIDVCSVKVNPVKVLRRVLPPGVQILATHPMFGPSSASNGIVGQPMMIYPVRLDSERYKRIKLFLNDTLKLHVIECTPEEHDKAMAYAQGLSHYIGRMMQIMEIPESELSTSAYQSLLAMKKVQGKDSWELFRSIMFENPYALDINQKFKQAMRELDAKLGID